MKTKHCVGCRNEIPISEFSRDRSRADGLQHRCKRCDAKYAKKYAATSTGKAARNQSVRKWRADPANLIKQQAHFAVAYAIQTGRMEHPSQCRFEDDTCSGIIVYHYPNHKRKLSVVPLCDSHHKRRHTKLKKCAEAMRKESD